MQVKEKGQQVVDTMFSPLSNTHTARHGDGGPAGKHGACRA